MLSSVFLLSALTTLSLAAPTPRSGFKLPHWDTIPKSVSQFLNGSCDCTAATQPIGTAALPAPANGLTLALVTIGRGVQNYTCADSTAASVPAPIGAVATLYNVNCLAASFPDILATLPAMALQYPVDQPPKHLTPAGQHYFQGPTTPVFDMGDVGFTIVKKAAAVPAAVPAADVAWLELEHVSAGPIQEVYRLNTAGGSPPANCLGSPSTFSVQYAAEYWFYTGVEV